MPTTTNDALTGAGQAGDTEPSESLTPGEVMLRTRNSPCAGVVYAAWRRAMSP